MEAQQIHNTNLAHQCARCTRSYAVMQRRDDGLVYCESCPDVPKLSIVERGAPPKPRARKRAAKTAPRKRARSRA